MNILNEELLVRQAMEIAEKLKNENEKARELALYDLRKLVVDLDLLELSEKGVNYEIVSFLYIIKKLVNDLWINFGSDSSYDFPIKIFKDYSVTLGHFISHALSNDQNQTTIYLFKTISEYYNNLHEIKIEGEKCDYA